MFARCARVAPACARDSSFAYFTWICLSFCSMDTPVLSGKDNEPFAPFTVTASEATVAVTPCGRSMMAFATRDMARLVLSWSLRDDAQDFAALADRARLLVRHHTLRRGDDDSAHTAEHLRELVLTAIDAQ